MQYIIYSIGTTSPGPRIKQLVTVTSGSNDICSALQNQASALLGRRYCVRPASPAGDLAGQVVIVTGASSGLGAEVVRQVVKRGATVVLACRNSQAAALVLEQMRKEGGAGQALFIHLDLLEELLQLIAAVRISSRYLHRVFLFPHLLGDVASQ